MVTIPEVWIPSPHYSTSRGGYNKVVLHTTEGAMKIRDLGAWFQNPGAQCSSHHGADNYEHLFGAYVYENYKAWTQGNANPYCLSLEMCSYSSWSRDTWLGKTRLLDNAAEWIHYCVVKYNVPWTLLNDSQAQNPDVRGICEHVNFGSWGSGHHDCGNFPMDVVFDKARKWGSGGSSPAPAPEEEEEEMVVIPPGSSADDSPDIGFSFPKYYTSIGFCADVGRMGTAPVNIRVALHHKTDMDRWDIKNVSLTPAKPKVVISFDDIYDGCSFRRQDDIPIDIIPNFK